MASDPTRLRDSDTGLGLLIGALSEPLPAVDVAGRFAAAEKQVAAIDSAMEPAPATTVCWRGAGSSVFAPGVPKDYVGEVYQEPGYTVVSTDMDEVEVPDGGWLMAVVVPAGTEGVFDPAANELILARHSKFKVVEANRRRVKVVVVDG